MIPEMYERPQGLHRKYLIHKADGSPVDPKAEYFLLRLDEHADPKFREASRKAVLCFAAEIEECLPELASDLRERYQQ